MLVCVFLCTYCTRDRGCSAHPVCPAPSDWRGRDVDGKTRANCAARSRSHVFDDLYSTSSRPICAIAHQEPGPIPRGPSEKALALDTFCKINGRGVWVPAFAGTTLSSNHLLRCGPQFQRGVLAKIRGRFSGQGRQHQCHHMSEAPVPRFLLQEVAAEDHAQCGAVRQIEKTQVCARKVELQLCEQHAVK